MNQKWRRPLAFLLSAAMVVSLSGSPVYAVENGQPAAMETSAGGLCEHHPEHTADCGYSERTPCGHEHDEGCYTLAENCVHEHTDECYPQADGSVSGNEATPSNGAEPTECSHVCGEDTGCITAELDCRHEHDGDCGYSEAAPCTFVCEECAAADEEPGTDDNAGTEEGEQGAEVPACTCDTLCTEDAINTDCPICGAEDADLTGCKSVEETTALEPECICDTLCTGNSINTDCPVCGAEDADLALCEGTEEIQCVCTEKCIPADGENQMEAVINQDCPVCSAEGADLTDCKGAQVENTLVQTITAWEWIDEEEALVFDGESGRWELALPGVNADNQADFDTVVSMLPQKISAAMEGTDEPEKITLSDWVCESYKQDGEGSWPISGTFLFTAAFPDGYLLAEDAGLPEIYVKISEITLYADGCNHEGGEGSTIGTDGICTVCRQFGYCGVPPMDDSVTWEMVPNDNDYTLTITGTGNMRNSYGGNILKDLTNQDRITDIIVESGVTSIGLNAFWDLNSVKYIQIPDSVINIENTAFKSCDSLVEIRIPDSVKQLGTECFGYCDSLTSVTLPCNIVDIPLNSFTNCTSLIDITIPETVVSIGNGAFQYCTSLETITIPDSVEEIGLYAFSGCTGLKELSLPVGITKISDQLVNGCSNLTSFTVPNGVNSIGFHSFSDCSNLKRLIIPPSVTKIDIDMLGFGVPDDLKIYNLSSCITDEITPKAAEYAITTVKDGKTEQQKVLPAAVAAGMEAYEGTVYDASYYYTDDGQGQWYVKKDSGYVPVTAESDFEDSPTFYYAKKLTADSISITVSPEEQIYDGAKAEYEITVKDGETVLTKDTHYTCEITSTDGNGTSAGTNAGMVTVTVTGVQSNGYIGTREVAFKIKQSGSAIPTGGVKTYKDGTETTTFTYGDTITVKVNAPQPTGVAPMTFAAPTADQMAVFKGNKQVSEAVDAVDGIYTMTVNTTDLLNGNLTLTVKYVGNENMADAVGTATVVVEAPFHAVTISTNKESLVYGEAVTLTAQVDLEEWADEELTYIWQYGNDIIDGETESTLTYDAGQLNAGTHEFSCTVDYLGFRLFKSKTITIDRADPTVNDVQVVSPSTIYDSTALDSISLSHSGTPGSIALSADQKLDAETTSYTWIFTPSDASNYNSLEGTIELTVEKDTLEGISIEGAPSKTSYTYGENFEVDGLTVTATYASGNTADVTRSVTFGELSAGQTFIELTYAEDGIEKSCIVDGITVAKGEQTALSIENKPTEPIPYGSEFTLTTSGGSGDGTVTWSASGPATVDASGKVSVTGVGEITVTATKAESANYNQAVATWTFTSTTFDLSTATVTLSQNSYTYNGTPQHPEYADITVVKNGVTIEQSGNYTVSFTNEKGGVARPTAAGAYTVTINKIGLNCTGKNSTATFEIKQATLTPTLTGDTTKVYDGTTAAPDGLAISLEGKVESDDVTATAGSCVYNSPNVAQADTITATGITLAGADAANYALVSDTAVMDDSEGSTVAITKKPLSDSMIADIPAQTYTGSEITPAVNVTDGNPSIITEEDYTVSYSEHIAVGTTATATITASADGNYSGTASRNFTITEGDSTVGEAAITDVIYGETFTVTFTPAILKEKNLLARMFSRAAAPKETAQLYYGDTLLAEQKNVTENTQVTLTVTADKKIPAEAFDGTGQTLTIRWGGDDNLNASEGTVTAVFHKRELTGTVNTGDASADKEYDGSASFTEVALTLTNLADGDAVTAAADGSADNTHAGQGKTFTASSVTLSGNDAGYYNLAVENVTGTVTITQKPLADSMIADIPAQTYTGSEITPALTVTDGDPSIITEKDYTAAYSDNIEVGTAATATITASTDGNYSGTASRNFTITEGDSTVGEAAITDVTYGETFTVTFTPAILKEKNFFARIFSRAAAPKETAQLYYGDTLLAEQENVTENTQVTFNVTANKKIPAEAFDGTEQTLTIRWGGDDNLNASEGAVTAVFHKRELTVAAVTAKNRAYDGTNQVTIVSITPDGVVGDDQVGVTAADLTGTIPGTDAATYESVTLSDLSGQSLTGADSGYYTFTQTTAEIPVTGGVTIARAAALELATTAEMVRNHKGYTRTVDLKATTGCPSDFGGTPAFEVASSGYAGLTGASVDADGQLTLVSNADSSMTGDTVTVRMTNMKNYEDSTITVKVTYTDKQAVTITGVSAAENLVYNGVPQQGYTGTPESGSYAGDYSVTYAGDGYSGATAPTDAGDYTVTIAVPESNETYTGSLTLSFTIGKRTLTVKADDKTVTVGKKMPALTYTVTGLAGDDTFTDPTVTTSADTGTVGKYDITVSGGTLTNQDSYTVTYQSGTLTVTEKLVPEVKLTPSADSFTGKGNVTLTVSGAPTGGTVTVTCSDESITVEGNGTQWTAKLPNKTASYVFTAVYSGNADYESVTATCTVEVTERYESDGNSSGGGNASSGGNNTGSNNNTVTTPPTPTAPDSPTTGHAALVTPDKDGSASIPDSAVDNAISAAKQEAEKNGKARNGIAVTVPVETTKDQQTLNVTLKAETLNTLVTDSVKRFTITTDDMISVSLDEQTLKALDSQTNGDIILEVERKAVSAQSLSKEAETAIGKRPVYDISLWYVNGGNKTPITAINGSTVSVAIPYTPARAENTGSLYAVYVADDGKVEWLTKSSYNKDLGAVIFEAEHFSIYGVGYKDPVPAFTDIAGHWAQEDMIFTASRGLLAGTSETAFSPDTGMTRGMFVTALGRLAGIDPAQYQAVKFSDVPADAYYAPYINWAAEKGIISGTSAIANTASPDTAITREQMAVILRNYAEKTGYALPETLEAVTFTDSAQISSWAKDAVKAMQQAGILAGKDGNRFDPAGTATRAEAAAALHRFVEIVIDPQTANGWTQNDSGAWYYYEDGKPVTGWLSDKQKWYWLDGSGRMFAGGWKEIDGKRYYFYEDGTMAVNTTIDGCEIGADGAGIKKQ